MYALAVADGEEHGDERGGGHGPAVAYGACRGSFRRSTSSSRRWIERTSSARFLDSLEAQQYAPPARHRRRPERRRPASLAVARRDARSARAHPRRPGLSRARNAALSPRRGRPRRVPRRRLRLSRRACSSASRGGFADDPDARRRHRPSRGRRGALVAVLEAGRRGPHGRQPLEPRDLLHDLPAPRARRAVGHFDERLGLGSGEPWSVGGGDRLPRPRACARARGSSTTRRSSSDTTFARTTRASAPATARASATSCASTATRARVVARMLVRPLGGRRWRRCARPGSARRALPARDAPRPHPRLPRREALEELGVTVEPGLEREALDRTPASRGRVAGQISQDAGDRLGQRVRRAAARPARIRPDGARRSRRRRRRAPARRRFVRRRREARTPWPRSRRSGRGR